MATPDWLEGPGKITRVIGANHPIYANTKDRCGQTIQAMLEVGHTGDGVHLARATGMSLEIGTFAGNGSARTIALSNSGLTPIKVFVWEPTNAPTGLDVMSEYAQPSRYTTTAWASNLVDNFQAGSFDVGASGINTNGVTNYYCVIGVDTDTVPVGDTGAGSDPDWIESSTLNRIIADNSAVVSSGNIANDVEIQIWTQYIEEHTTAGAHSITLQHIRVDTVTWAGNDGDDRVIALNITDLQPMYVEVYKDGVVVATKSSDMTGDNTKLEATAGFLANYIQDITVAGQITVGTARNGSGNTYIAYIIGV